MNRTSKKTEDFLSLIACAILILLTLTVLEACGSHQDGDSRVQMGDDPFALAPANVRLSLTDKPIDVAANVNLNIDRVEIFVQKNNKQARVIVSNHVGFVDILELQNNVLKSLGDIQLPPTTIITQVRIVLSDGNNIAKKDGSICQLKTPGTKHSAVKLAISNSFNTEAIYSYSVVLDFDLDQAISFSGTECALKPFVNVKSATKTPLPPSNASDPFPKSSNSNSHVGSNAASSMGQDPIPLPTSGQSDGNWSDEEDAADPSVLTPQDLWSL